MKVHILEGTGFDSNQYLIEGDKALLVDTGSGLYLKDTMRFIESHVKKLDTIILTHRHIDHVGGAKFISEKFGCEIFASTDDSMPLIMGKQESGISLGLEMPKLRVKTLEYGELLKDFELEIMHSPGHTIGGITLYNKAEKSLFSGDTIFAYGGVGRWDLETGSRAQLLDSIKKIANLNIENLYPGHGSSIEGNAHEHVLMALNTLEVMAV